MSNNRDVVGEVHECYRGVDYFAMGNLCIKKKPLSWSIQDGEEV